MAAAGQTKGNDRSDQTYYCQDCKPAPGRQAGIPPGALADLIQPSHLLRTDNHVAVSLSRCLAGTRCSHYIHSLVRP